MPPLRRTLVAVVAAASAVTLALTGKVLPQATAAPPAPTYTVTVGAKGTWKHPSDTPANPYIDKDGTFYFQQAAALYGADGPRVWDFYTGTDFDTAAKDEALSTAVTPNKKAESEGKADSNGDTTWRCNNSPTGREATDPPKGSSYSQKNFCDLSGVWVDPDSGDWYGLVHNEFTPQPFKDGSHYDAIDYAVSRDQGRTWDIKDHVLTSPYSTKRNDDKAFPQQTYSYGDGDQRLFVDTASGYFYVYYGSRIVDKSGGWKAFYEHVARAPISAKMAPGSWRKWYDGAWSQPGPGGRESNIVPVDADHPTGYTPLSAEYDPANTGTSAEQIAAGKMPPTSPLFVMNIAYDAYLGRYIGTPQAVDQSGKAAQQLYVTDDLSTQKWRLLGDTGDYTTASWYRWLLDSGNRTDSTIVGKSFRSYCSFGCSKGSSSEYVDITVDSSEPAAAPVEPGKPYRIGNGAGRVLAQVSGGSATTSVASVSGNDLASWTFSANGDGSFRIANASTHQLLGVDSTSTAGRKWGTKPVVSAAGAHGPAVGQQWFIVPSASGKGARATAFRLVNRYSGLVLGMSSDTGRLAETTPARHWTNATGNAVGGSRTADEQILTFTPSASASQPAPSSSSTSDIPPRTPPSGSPSAGKASSDAATGAGSCTDPAWNSTTIYTGGETVSHRHGRWKARWWTRNNEPGGPTNWGQWEEAGTC